VKNIFAGGKCSTRLKQKNSLSSLIRLAEGGENRKLFGAADVAIVRFRSRMERINRGKAEFGRSAAFKPLWRRRTRLSGTGRLPREFGTENSGGNY